MDFGRFLRLSCVMSVLTGVFAGASRAQELTVAAASDLQAAMPEIVSRFEQETGQRVRVTYGSSGNFFSQIQHGAPFDLYFSADIDYPKRLEAADLVEPGTLRLYAIGRLVLWTPHSSAFDLGRGLQALVDPGVRRIAIANPAHAPYGRAAVAALQAAKVYERVRPKLVLGENISQAAQFASSRNADAGIVALSVVRTPAMQKAGRYVEIAPASYPPLEQGAVMLKRARNKPLATRFLAAWDTPVVARILERAGFTVPRPRH